MNNPEPDGITNPVEQAAPVQPPVSPHAVYGPKDVEMMNANKREPFNAEVQPSVSGAREWRTDGFWTDELVDAYVAYVTAAERERCAELAGKAAEFDAATELPLPDFVESELAPHGLPLYGRIKMLIDAKGAAETALAEAQAALRAVLDFLTYQISSDVEGENWVNWGQLEKVKKLAEAASASLPAAPKEKP